MSHTTTAVYLILLGQLSPALSISINALRSWLSLGKISDKWMYILISAIIIQFSFFGSLP